MSSGMLGACDLIQDQPHHATVATGLVVFDGHANRRDDQLTQQVGDFEDPARFGQIATHALVDVQRPHRHMTATAHLMSDTAGNPQGSLRRRM